MNRLNFGYENYPTVEPSDTDPGRTLSPAEMNEMLAQNLAERLSRLKVSPLEMADMLNASCAGVMDGLSRSVAIGTTLHKTDATKDIFSLVYRPDSPIAKVVAPGLEAPVGPAISQSKSFLIAVTDRLIDLHSIVEKNLDSSKLGKDSDEVRAARKQLASSIVNHAIGLIAHGDIDTNVVNANTRAFAEYVYPKGTINPDTDMSDGSQYFAAYNGLEEKVYGLVRGCKVRADIEDLSQSQ